MLSTADSLSAGAIPGRTGAIALQFNTLVSRCGPPSLLFEAFVKHVVCVKVTRSDLLVHDESNRNSKRQPEQQECEKVFG